MKLFVNSNRNICEVLFIFSIDIVLIVTIFVGIDEKRGIKMAIDALFAINGPFVHGHKKLDMHKLTYYIQWYDMIDGPTSTSFSFWAGRYLAFVSSSIR